MKGYCVVQINLRNKLKRYVYVSPIGTLGLVKSKQTATKMSDGVASAISILFFQNYWKDEYETRATIWIKGKTQVAL